MRQSNDSVGLSDTASAPLTILIVEDNPDDLRFYQRLLDRQASFPCRVLTAATGAEGLSQAQSASPMCILLDDLLPDMDGLRFLDELRRLPARAAFAVVVLTSQSDTDVAVKAIQRGAHDYVDKGALSQERLVQIIVNAATQVALQRELRDKESALQETLLGNSSVWRRAVLLALMKADV